MPSQSAMTHDPVIDCPPSGPPPPRSVCLGPPLGSPPRHVCFAERPKACTCITFSQISTTDRTHARTGPDKQRAQAPLSNANVTLQGRHVHVHVNLPSRQDTHTTTGPVETHRGGRRQHKNTTQKVSKGAGVPGGVKGGDGRRPCAPDHNPCPRERIAGRLGA